MERSLPPLKRIAVLLIIVSITFISVGGGITLSNMLAPLPDFSTMPFQDGMSFTTFGVASYNSTAAEAEILKMKAIGVEWVAVNSWWFQDNLTATVIHNGTWSDSPENLSAFFQFIRAQGMHVMFKPMVDSLDGLWRSNINASPAWLVEYERFLNMTASIAQAGGADILCVGTEMGSWQVHTDAVRHALWSIKQIYSGKLTYSANHDSFWYVDWWDDPNIDYIGISWYPPFTMSYNPSLDDLIAVWNAFYDPLYQFARKYGKPILLTEIGAQARDGTNMVPNDDKFSSKQDVGELVMMYQALFQSKVWSASWFKGAYWWMWYIGDPDPTGFSPNLPQVEAVIQQAYTQPPQNMPPSNLLPAIVLLAGIICLPVGVLAWVRQSKTQPNPLEGDDKTKKTQLRKWVILTGVNFGLLASWAGFFYNQATFQTIYAAYSQSQFLGTNPLTIYVGIGLTALGAISLGTVLAKIATRTRKSATPAAGALPLVAGCLSLAVFAGFWGINLRSFSPVLVLAVLALAAWAASTGSFLVLHAPPAKRADMARGAIGILIVGGAVITGISL
ncbi:MAG TPA: hypothetical protein VKK79_06320, partial [Candidatus Lokiarchaeia archaeon]|nr:hypothetical protein [Candidatus Lokiarchaeia archaeon]